jgi:hypothetical protein
MLLHGHEAYSEQFFFFHRGNDDNHGINQDKTIKQAAASDWV